MCFLKDLTNHSTVMVLLYIEASNRSLKGDGTTTLPRDIAPKINLDLPLI